MTRVSGFAAVLVLASVALAQTEFSADVVDTQKSGTPTLAKIYFAKDRMRIEWEDRSGKSGGAFIENFAAQTVTVLMPQRQMYTEVPAQAQNQRMYGFFAAGDAENACGDWQKMMQNQGRSCHRVGSDTVNGRRTIKYEGTSTDGDTSTFWLDPKLRFPVKWEGKNGGELRNIQEGAQPANLFEVPAGYTRFDMGAMMKQHQQ